MGQKYGELAQVYWTGEAFEYDISVRPAVSGDKDIDAMDRAMYMERMAERHKAKAMQSTTNIQLYLELYNKLHDAASKKLLDDQLWGEIDRKQDPKGLMTAVTKIMLLSSSGNLHQDTHRARMIYNVLGQSGKEGLQDYYYRTMRSLATQSSLGYKTDADIDEAMDFTYKLDRKIFQTMITNMDWIEESEIGKFQLALRADPTLVHVTTYPANLAEAFQRANLYQLGHRKTTTGTVADNLLQTVFASDISSDPQKKKHEDSRKTIPREEWLRMTKEQQDAVKAKNKARPKCEYCDKPGDKESKCRTLKSATAELKKANAKKFVAITTATPAEAEEDEEEPFEAVYVHSTETVLYNQYNSLCEDPVLCDHCASASILRNKNLLTNFRQSGTITFTGIGGSIDVTQQNDFGVYDERATFNVISVDSLPKSSVVTYNHAARCQTIIIQGEVWQERITSEEIFACISITVGAGA